MPYHIFGSQQSRDTNDTMIPSVTRSRKRAIGHESISIRCKVLLRPDSSSETAKQTWITTAVAKHVAAWALRGTREETAEQKGALVPVPIEVQPSSLGAVSEGQGYRNGGMRAWVV